MSALVHCDGPSCDRTRPTGYEDRALCEVGWTHVEQTERGYDFHHPDCLIRWAGGSVERDEVAAFTALRKAWTDAGPQPDFHQRAKLQLANEWPTLADALNVLFGR